MLKTELLRMKERCGLTNEDISKRSLVPLQTVNNVFSGRTQDPGYSTVAALVKAMHGSMDDIEGLIHKPEHKDHHELDCEKCERRIEKNKELYERLFAEQKETIKSLKDDLKDREKSIDSKNKWITALFILAGLLIISCIAVVLCDIFLPSIGWVTY